MAVLLAAAVSPVAAAAGQAREVVVHECGMSLEWP